MVTVIRGSQVQKVIAIRSGGSVAGSQGCSAKFVVARSRFVLLTRRSVTLVDRPKTLWVWFKGRVAGFGEVWRNLVWRSLILLC